MAAEDGAATPGTSPTASATAVDGRAPQPRAEAGAVEGTPIPQPRYQIGAVAARTELSHQTLRHWDEVGLVSPSQRSEGGFRLYSETDIERLLVIRRMKPLEFSLAEMRQLLHSLDLLADSTSSPAAREEAIEFVQACHRRAQDSITRLRKRLAYAQELTDILATQCDAAMSGQLLP